MLEQQPVNNSENGKIEKGSPRNEASREEKRHRVRYCAGKTRRDPSHGAKDDAGTAKAVDRFIGKAGAEPLLMGRFCYFLLLAIKHQTITNTGNPMPSKRQIHVSLPDIPENKKINEIIQKIQTKESTVETQDGMLLIFSDFEPYTR